MGDLDLIPGLEDPMEESMATRSSILPGESPWIEEAGRLQSMGLQRFDNAEQPSRQHILTLLEKTDAGDITVCP